MTTRLYAIRVDADRIVAAEVDDHLAAVLFDNGHSILLATKAELDRIAKRRRTPLTVLLRQRTVTALPSTTVRADRPRAGLVVDVPAPELALQAR